MNTGIDKLLAEHGMALKDFGLLFARQLTALAVDPHGYFEKKYIARIENAISDQEINGVLAQLVLWAASSSLSDTERARLDQQLNQQGLPCVSELSALLLP